MTDREIAFKLELHALLKKHGAQLEITDDGKDFGMHSGVAIVTLRPEYESFKLDGFMDGGDDPFANLDTERRYSG